MNNLLKTLLIILFIITGCSSNEEFDELESQFCECVKTETIYNSNMLDHIRVTNVNINCLKDGTTETVYSGATRIEVLYDCK